MKYTFKTITDITAMSIDVPYVTYFENKKEKILYRVLHNQINTWFFLKDKYPELRNLPHSEKFLRRFKKYIN